MAKSYGSGLGLVLASNEGSANAVLGPAFEPVFVPNRLHDSSMTFPLSVLFEDLNMLFKSNEMIKKSEPEFRNLEKVEARFRDLFSPPTASELQKLSQDAKVASMEPSGPPSATVKGNVFVRVYRFLRKRISFQALLCCSFKRVLHMKPSKE